MRAQSTTPLNRLSAFGPALFAVALLLPTNVQSTAVDADATARSIRDALAGQQAPSSIHALRVGTSSRIPRGFVIADPTFPRKVTIDFSFYVIEGARRIILVDTGFVNRQMIEKYDIQGYRDPVFALKEIGIERDQVTDVVITHGHWDHVGGIYRFKNARIWINKRVFGSLKGTQPLQRFLKSAKAAGRLRLTKGITQVAPGVAAVTVGHHAPGFQYVVVSDPGGDGVWVLASDIAPLFDNFERGIPTGQTDAPKATLEIQATITALVRGKLSRVVPGHDPKIFDSGNNKCIAGAKEVRSPATGPPQTGSPGDNASSDR